MRLGRLKGGCGKRLGGWSQDNQGRLEIQGFGGPKLLTWSSGSDRHGRDWEHLLLLRWRGRDGRDGRDGREGRKEKKRK